MEQTCKIMRHIRLIVPRIQFFGQCEEGIWVVVEESNFKYGLSIGEVVLLQVVVQAAAWRPVRERRAGEGSYNSPLFSRTLILPEIWDATGRADPSSSHHYHPLIVPLSDILGNVLQGALLLRCTATTGEKTSRPMPVCLTVIK